MNPPALTGCRQGSCYFSLVSHTLYLPTYTLYLYPQAKSNCDHKKQILSASAINTLKSCHQAVSANKARIGQTFYNILFASHPSLRSVFNMSHQRPSEDGTPGPQVLAGLV